MFQFFTAKVGKLIEIEVPNETGNEKDPDSDKGQPALGEKVPVAYLELDLAEQDAKPAVVSTLVQGVRTSGKSTGQLLPFKDGVTAHLVFDLAFLRRLKPGTLLRVEWETRAGGVMQNLLALAHQK